MKGCFCTSWTWCVRSQAPFACRVRRTDLGGAMTSFMYYFFDAFWSIKANSERSELNYDSFFANLNPGVHVSSVQCRFWLQCRECFTSFGNITSCVCTVWVHISCDRMLTKVVSVFKPKTLLFFFFIFKSNFMHLYFFLYFFPFNAVTLHHNNFFQIFWSMACIFLCLFFFI